MKLFKQIGLIGLTVIWLLLVHAEASAKGRTRHSTIWTKVAQVPFTIVPRTIEGAPDRPDQNAIAQRLSDEAGARTERLLLMRHMAATVERAASAQAASAQGATSPVIISGTLTLPLSLPPGVIGLRASSRDGVFATAKVVLMDAGGKVLASEETTLNWGDAWWLSGGRGKRNIPLDEVLLKFTRKSVDRAVERLARRDWVALKVKG